MTTKAQARCTLVPNPCGYWPRYYTDRFLFSTCCDLCIWCIIHIDSYLVHCFDLCIWCVIDIIFHQSFRDRCRTAQCVVIRSYSSHKSKLLAYLPSEQASDIVRLRLVTLMVGGCLNVLRSYGVYLSCVNGTTSTYPQWRLLQAEKWWFCSSKVSSDLRAELL